MGPDEMKARINPRETTESAIQEAMYFKLDQCEQFVTAVKFLDSKASDDEKKVTDERELLRKLPLASLHRFVKLVDKQLHDAIREKEQKKKKEGTSAQMIERRQT